MKVPQVAVVFTDGGSQDKERTRREAQRLRNEAGMYEPVKFYINLGPVAMIILS